MSATAARVPVDETAAEGYQWEPSDAQIAAAYGLDPADVVRFDTNTSPRTPDGLAAWIADAAGAGPRGVPPLAPLNEYPDATYAELTSAISESAGVPRSRIVVGAGADEILDIVAKTCLEPGGSAVMPAPSYGMYPVLTRQRRARLVQVPRRPAHESFSIDPDAVARAADTADLVWLCDPNNPTGNVEPPGVLIGLLERLAEAGGSGPVVVVDEAYREFAGESLLAAIDRFPRLVVVRTLSKAYGLAGVRVGYAVAQEALVERLSAVRPPGSISTLSAAIGAAALRDGDFARTNVASIVAERERLRAELRRAGWRVQPGVANFLLVDFGGPDGADRAAARLLEHGLVPRRFGEGPLRGHLRLTVRTPAQDDRLLAALGRRTT